MFIQCKDVNCPLLNNILKESGEYKSRVRALEDERERLKAAKSDLKDRIRKLESESIKVKLAKDEAQISKCQSEQILCLSEAYLKIDQVQSEIDKKTFLWEEESSKISLENAVERAKSHTQINFHILDIEDQIAYFDRLRGNVKFPRMGQGSAILLSFLLVIEILIISVFGIIYYAIDCSSLCAAKQIAIYVVYGLLVASFVGIGFIASKVIHNSMKIYNEDKETYNEWQKTLNNKILKLML